MSSIDQSSETHSVLLPIKAFGRAKERLASSLSIDQRSALARTLAEGVIRAARPLHVAVVCDDDEVAAWAKQLGALVIWAPQKGLNAAVEHGVGLLGAEGFTWITISHADLPYPGRLATLPDFEGVTLVPDRHGDGTNVIKIPARSGFCFAYGKGSFSRHRQEAGHLGLPLCVLHDPQLSIDVDDVDDLAFVEAQTRQWGPEGPH
jgi:2-phospho-L-lactate guanylyltransferase